MVVTEPEQSYYSLTAFKVINKKNAPIQEALNEMLCINKYCLQ